MTLIQISDCHLFATPEQTGYGDINPADSLRSILREAMSYAPDGLLFTGDISGDDSAESYQLFLKRLNEVIGETPWRVIPGNHDNNPAFNEILKANWLSSDMPWSLGKFTVHGLDTRYEGTQGTIEEAQLNEVGRRIAGQPDALHLLAIHHHPVATNSWMDKHKLHNVDALAIWLTDHPVSAVLHGHIHAQTQAELSNTPVLGVPSSSWQWQLTPEFGLAKEAPGFRVIECVGNKISTRIQRIK